MEVVQPLKRERVRGHEVVSLILRIPWYELIDIGADKMRSKVEDLFIAECTAKGLGISSDFTVEEQPDLLTKDICLRLCATAYRKKKSDGDEQQLCEVGGGV